MYLITFLYNNYTCTVQVLHNTYTHTNSTLQFVHNNNNTHTYKTHTAPHKGSDRTDNDNEGSISRDGESMVARGPQYATGASTVQK